ncbi:hypothetical protein E4U41_007787 [Claviceps citrina]|nr:hypothetical protein E4U41_007787 [Claviceps citrina]
MASQCPVGAGRDWAAAVIVSAGPIPSHAEVTPPQFEPAALPPQPPRGLKQDASLFGSVLVPRTRHGDDATLRGPFSEADEGLAKSH